MRLLPVCCLLFACGLLPAQSADYFQQQVDYTIDVTLDDSLHQLRGTIEFVYTNNAPEALDSMYLHIWPNAYSNQQSAFAAQQLRFGNLRFFNAPPDQLGALDSLAISVDGQSVAHSAHQSMPDVVGFSLPDPVPPGASVTVKSPFRVRIPASFSRLGRVGTSYQLTQWYPKPAVYDRTGWHPMPYLDQGEFYSEFGSFDVRITLPRNYWVAATGALQTETERRRITQRAAETRAWLDTTYALPTLLAKEPFPPSSDTLKTLHYTAENVHDFAWFADKRFRILEDTIQLSSGAVTTGRTFFTRTQAELWRRSMEYVKRSTRFYSQLVGEYPYPHVTAVQSALSAGAGMEYPMITVIGLAQDDRRLDEVITHEVGHNWFYGILASNERIFPWMDEGVNSYYENRYMRKYYPNEDLSLPLSLAEGSKLTLEEAAYLYLTRSQKETPPESPSDVFSSLGYGIGAYSKPAAAFRQLQEWVGAANLDRAMQAFYDAWQFRHPYPDDLQQVLERELNRDLSWLFQGFLQSTDQMDYGILDIRTGRDSIYVKVANRGAISAPFPIVGQNDWEDIFDTVWVAGFSGTREVGLPRADYDLVVIDPGHVTLEAFRNNNEYRPESIFPRFEPLQVRFLGALENESRSQLFLLPVAGYNTTDGFMIGLGFHNRALLPRTFEWAVAPLFGTQSEALTGWAGARYRLFPESNWIQEINLRGTIRRFGLDKTSDGDFLHYWRFVPGVDLIVRKSPFKSLEQRVSFRAIILESEADAFFGQAFDGNPIFELSYDRRQRVGSSVLHFHAALEQQSGIDVFPREQDYLKLRLTADGRFPYSEDNFIHWRFFGGYFFSNSLRNGTFIANNAFSLFDYGAADYRFDDLYFGRFEQEGTSSQQLAARAGGFHAPVPSSQGFLGRSNNYLLSATVKMDLPFLPKAIPLRPYVDIGYYDPVRIDGTTPPSEFLYNAGVALELFDGRIGLYAPLIGTEELMNVLDERGNFLDQLSFRINFDALAPWKLFDLFE